MSVPSFWTQPAKTARRLLLASALAFPACVLAQAPAAAPVPPMAAPAASEPSESAMVNLVRALVAQKVLKKEQGDALMAQALAEAEQARAARAPVRQAQTEMPAPAPGTIRVPYVPETVRAQIRDELKTEVLAQARSEGWAAPGDASPDWVKRIKLTGDIRVRSQSNLFSRNNSDQIPDFARINQIGPIPILDRGYFIPLLNSRVDRASRMFLRARLGLEAKISDGIDAGVTLATGSDNSPISTNQNLGGGLAKRDIWLDQAWLRVRPTAETTFQLGRFVNPFISTELLFDEDLRFDGVATKVDFGKFFSDDYTVSLRGGAFPLDFGDPNFPQNDVEKRNARERWLFSGQLELGAPLGDSGSVRLAGAYHVFKNFSSNLSEPCFLYRLQAEFRGGVICSTDNERATFLRKGNTVAPIRDIVLDVPAPAVNETRVSPQFVGLVFDYRILNVNAQVDYKLTDDLNVTLNGDYVRNLAFDKKRLCRYSATVSAAYPPLNNVGADGDGNVCSLTNPSTFVGGNQGYKGTLMFSHDELFKKGAWQAKFSYTYLESDAVLDAFSDSIFHLSGTNAKGYELRAKGSLFDGMTIGARWLSSNEISGEPLRIDVLQADIEVRF